MGILDDLREQERQRRAAQEPVLVQNPATGTGNPTQVENEPVPESVDDGGLLGIGGDILGGIADVGGQALSGLGTALDVSGKYGLREPMGWVYQQAAEQGPGGEALGVDLTDELFWFVSGQGEEKKQAVRESESNQEAFDARFEGQPYARFAFEALADPLNLAGGAGGVARLAKLADTAGDVNKARGLYKGSQVLDFVDRVQALPLTLPARGIAKAAAKTGLDRPIKAGLEVTKRSRAAKLTRDLITALQMNDDELVAEQISDYAPADYINLVARTLEEAPEEELGAQRAIQTLFDGSDDALIGRAFFEAEEEGLTGLETVLGQELQRRDLMRPANWDEAVDTDWVHTNKLISYATLDEALDKAAVAPAERNSAFRILDLFAGAAYASNPGRYSDPDEVYRFFRFIPASEDEIADAARHMEAGSMGVAFANEQGPTWMMVTPFGNHSTFAHEIAHVLDTLGGKFDRATLDREFLDRAVAAADQPGSVRTAAYDEGKDFQDRVLTHRKEEFAEGVQNELGNVLRITSDDPLLQDLGDLYNTLTRETSVIRQPPGALTPEVTEVLGQRFAGEPAPSVYKDIRLTDVEETTDKLIKVYTDNRTDERAVRTIMGKLTPEQTLSTFEVLDQALRQGGPGIKGNTKAIYGQLRKLTRDRLDSFTTPPAPASEIVRSPSDIVDETVDVVDELGTQPGITPEPVTDELTERVRVANNAVMRTVPERLPELLENFDDDVLDNLLTQQRSYVSSLETPEPIELDVLDALEYEARQRDQLLDPGTDEPLGTIPTADVPADFEEQVQDLRVMIDESLNDPDDVDYIIRRLDPNVVRTVYDEITAAGDQLGPEYAPVREQMRNFLEGSDASLTDPLIDTGPTVDYTGFQELETEFPGGPLFEPTGTPPVEPTQVRNFNVNQTVSPLTESVLRIGNQLSEREGITVAGENVNRVEQTLAPIFEANKDKMSAVELVTNVGTTRRHIERALRAETPEQIEQATQDAVRSLNLQWTSFGLQHPALGKILNAAGITDRTQKRATSLGRSFYGTRNLDSQVELLNRARSMPEVQEFQKRYDEFITNVQALVSDTLPDKEGFDASQMTVHDVIRALDHVDQKTADQVRSFMTEFALPTELGLSDELLHNTLKQINREGIAKSFNQGISRELGVKSLERSQIRKLVGTLPSLWREQALFSVRYHLQNAMDMTLKSLIFGINPLRGSQSSITYSERMGLTIPESVRSYDVREELNTPSITPKTRPSAWRNIPVVGRPVGKLMELNFGLARSMEDGFRMSAWAATVRDFMREQFMPNFQGEIERVGRAYDTDLSEVWEVVQKRQGEIGTEELFELVEKKTGDVRSARELAIIWSRGLDEGSVLGVQRATDIHFDFLDERVAEEKFMVRTWAPFHFWATRNIPFYLQTMTQHPEMMRAWQTYDEISDDERERMGLTSRFMGTLPVEGLPIVGDAVDPILEFFFGEGQAFFNPLVVMSLADQFKPRYQSEDNTALGRILNEAGRFGLSPAPWINVIPSALGVYGPQAEAPNFLRHGGLLEPLIGIDPEQPLQDIHNAVLERATGEKKFTLTGDSYKDYSVRKKIADMSYQETGEFNHPDYVQAMADPRSPIFQRALAQVNEEDIWNQLLGLANPFPMKYLTEPEAVVRESNAALPDERTPAFNRLRYQTGHPSTGYSNIYGDLREAQISAGFSSMDSGGTGVMLHPLLQSLSGGQQAALGGTYPWFDRYLAWRNTMPEGADDSIATFLEQNPR